MKKSKRGKMKKGKRLKKMKDERKTDSTDGRLDILLRTKQFALRVIEAYSSLPERTEAQVIGKQLLRSGTSVGAHVREGRRSRSDAEMISKFEVALQELDETSYWIDLLRESAVTRDPRLTEITREANELTGILVASVKTIKKRRKKINDER